MATLKTFEELECWKAAKEFYVRCRALVTGTSLEKEYHLKEQLLRAALSISNNIAEGFERGGEKEFRRFIIIANGSLSECRNMIIIISEVFPDLNQHQIQELHTLALKVISLNKGLIKYLNTRIS